MNFNIEEMLSQMQEAIKSAVTKDWENISPKVKEILNVKTDIFLALLLKRFNSIIPEKEFELLLNKEKIILEIELLKFSKITKRKAYKASESAIKVIKEYNRETAEFFI